MQTSLKKIKETSIFLKKQLIKFEKKIYCHEFLKNLNQKI